MMPFDGSASSRNRVVALSPSIPVDRDVHRLGYLAGLEREAPATRDVIGAEERLRARSRCRRRIA